MPKLILPQTEQKLPEAEKYVLQIQTVSRDLFIMDNCQGQIYETVLSPGWRHHDELSRYGLCFHGAYN